MLLGLYECFLVFVVCFSCAITSGFGSVCGCVWFGFGLGCGFFILVVGLFLLGLGLLVCCRFGSVLWSIALGFLVGGC